MQQVAAEPSVVSSDPEDGTEANKLGEADVEACAEGAAAPAPPQPAAAAAAAAAPELPVYLNVEVLSDRATQWLLSIQHVSLLGALAMLGYFTWLKFVMPPSWYFQDHTIRRINLGFACALLPGLFAVAYAFAKRVVASVRAHRTWTNRRRHLTTLHGLQLCVTILNVGSWLGVSAYASWGCPSKGSKHAALAGSFISGFSWNATLLISLIVAHNLLPAELSMVPLAWLKKRSRVFKPLANAGTNSDKDALVMDLPWYIHLPKVVLLWLPTQVAVLLLLLYGLGAVGPSECRKGAFCGAIKIISAEGPCSTWIYSCVAEKWMTGISIMMATLFLTQMGVFMYLIWRGLREYKRRSYAKFRQANLLLRILLHTRLPAAVVFALSIVLMWFVRLGSCATWSMTQNMLPVQVVIASLSAIDALLCMPASEEQGKPERRSEMAWTEEEAEEIRRERGTPDAELFCFEIAVKLLYLSMAVYYLGEEEAVPGVSMDMALGLFGHDEEAHFWDKAPYDTKCLVTWGRGTRTIVIAFRGTASLASVLADLQVWQVRHRHLERSAAGKGPLVHAGFLACWTANDFNQRIIGKVQEIIGAAGGAAGQWQIFCTGHSLGGALATLAALDLATAYKDTSTVRIRCYTYGAPRTGSHSFARECNKRVSAHYRVVVGDDVVPKAGKFLFMFKHCGKQIIINEDGDLIVWPRAIERDMHAVAAATSVRAHLLSSYQLAFTAVMRAQFGNKSDGGQVHLQQLWKNCEYALALTETMGIRQASLQTLLTSNVRQRATPAAADSISLI